jgi:hypothetical protein
MPNETIAPWYGNMYRINLSTLNPPKNMERFLLTEALKRLKSEERYDMIFGPQRKKIEKTMGCKILTIPLDQLGAISSGLLYFLVTDRYKGNSYLAVLKPVK